MSVVPKRIQIRKAIVQILKDKTDCDDRVYPNRLSGIWKSEFPCINVFSVDEVADPRNLSGSTKYIRTMTVSVQIIAEANELLDEKLDEIADAVETEIDSNPSLNGTAQAVVLTSTEIELSNDPQIDVGSLTLVYSIQYLK